MTAVAILSLWLAANYALAAAFVYRGARCDGVDRPAARRAALSWPFAMFGPDASRRDDARPALPARNA